MQRIIPNLWFDHTAAQAADFYTSIFPNARIVTTQYYPSDHLPDFQREFAGQPLAVEFEIDGYRLAGINAGPEFPINPSVSLMLNFDPSRDAAARDHLDALWAALSAGGRVLMPLGEYPFSPRYGWVADRYGVSWQLIVTNPEGEPRPFVMPTMLFGAGAQNRAGEAIDRYASVFPGARVGSLSRYPEPTGPARAGSIQFADIELLGQWFALMDAGADQDSSFTCGVSLMIECADQAEIDYYWSQLSEVPDAEQCGWCADRFGLSWQVVPANLDDLMRNPGAYDKLMAMKKLDIAAFG